MMRALFPEEEAKQRRKRGKWMNHYSDQHRGSKKNDSANIANEEPEQPRVRRVDFAADALLDAASVE